MRISDWSSDVCSSDLPHGASSLWVWGSWRSKELASADFSVHVTPDTHVAAGTLTRGIEGFRQSHLEALQTADLVRTSTHIAGASLTHYADVEDRKSTRLNSSH